MRHPAYESGITLLHDYASDLQDYTEVHARALDSIVGIIANQLKLRRTWRD